ncbi:phosphodiester glycosidase family protein [Desulfobacca acetoxidans]|uniref:Phosphodiester glycosidase domain-containing protein n=1 Tax=Desulfobacca acetoxidans (strain ATCC 700848 / DSM 11109 / ASRB2) TaxID=880072 RepID=F2NHQ1_DESAR|nr:phosphodiester glycosidase family protein [Desulfobacca acetoxidans]AEB09238.1 Protein of unknown function DUF2233, periplasmic [Desulfobacca acetoxidans DSM 11109]
MFGIFLLVLLCLLPNPVSAQAQELHHTTVSWQEIGKGLSFSRLDVIEKGDVVESLSLVRIDPNYNSFRLFHGKARRMSEWRDLTQAAVLINGSYYTPNGQPCGLVKIDDKLYGPLRNSAMRGMFVAEPRGVSPDLPRATILDLTAAPVNIQKLPWTQGLMSFPLLLDSQGRIRVRSSNQSAQRTVICTDRKGNILILHSAGDYFSLYELAKFLKASPLEIDLALNLDGGSKAQLLIHTSRFTLASPSFLEQSARELFDAEASLLPTVIGVFPRED